MYKINKIKNYKDFATMLEKHTGCSIKIKLMRGKDHIHYQLNDKYGISLGVLCMDDGQPSFAPFVTLETAEDNQYINLKHVPQFDDFAHVLGVFKEIFVETCLE